MLRFMVLLLRLYPRQWQGKFSTEMSDVLRQVCDDARSQGVLSQCRLWIKESAGLLRGAVQERFWSPLGDRWFPVANWRLAMRSEFRYPRATAPIMTLIFVAIMLVIYKAGTVQPQAEYSTGYVLIFAVALLVVAAVGGLGWLVLHWLRRSGVHRLAEVQTWPQPK